MNNDNLISADLYRIVSRGFSYPTEENVQFVKEIIPVLLSNDKCIDKYKKVLNEIYKCSDTDELQLVFSRSLMKGNPPTTESYCTQNANSFSDVAAFYSAFGMKAKTGDTPDAISYEAEFIAMLLVKELIAKEPGQKEITRDALIKFLDVHFNTFAEIFVEKVKKADLHGYYNAVAELIGLLLVEQKELVNKYKTINV